MKSFIVFVRLMLVVMILHSVLFAAEKKVKSEVTAVTVYNDRALITRTALVNLPMGQQSVIIGELPSTLFDQSLQVGGEADAIAKILDVKIETTYIDTIPEARIHQLYKNMVSLKEEMQTLFNKEFVIRAQLGFIDSVTSSYAGSVSKGVSSFKTSLDDWERMLKFIERNQMPLYENLSENNRRQAEVRNRIDALEREIKQSQSISQKSQKQINVTLNNSKSGNVTLRISYVISGASWSPIYEARTAGDSKVVQFTYSAMVKQTTHEDWSNIDLTLSTAKPMAGGAPIELSPWQIDMASTSSVGHFRGGRSQEEIYTLQGMSLKKDEVVVTAQRPDVEADKTSASAIVQSDAAIVEVQQTSSVFHIPVKANIPSDNDPHKVVIAVRELPVTFEYTSIPKNSVSAYLKAKGKNVSEYPLLAGPMNVFFENSFIATSQLKSIMPQDSLEMYFGSDESVRVERKMLNKFTEYTGTFSKRSKVTYDFLITIKNLKMDGIVLSMKDQLPVSRNEKVQIEVITPSKEELAPDADGTLIWNLKLGAGEKKELKLKFSIEFPREMPVQGL
jgi:uncharacterized protein (TIGR02231 family)